MDGDFISAVKNGYRCAVTGANGFIGTHLIAELASMNVSVTAFTRTPWSASPGCESVAVGDINGDIDWHWNLIEHNVVIHLANAAHINLGKNPTPESNVRGINVDGTLKLAQQAADAGVRRFIYVSSIKVHGERSNLGAFNHLDPTRPEDLYGECKVAAEFGLSGTCAGTGMELVIIRPPLVYGPGVKGNLAQLLHWIDRGVPLPFGNINNQRDLISLKNLVDLIVTCIDHPAAAGQTFLCSDNQPMSTAELVRYIADARGVPSKLIDMPLPILKSLLSVIGKSGAYHRLAADLRVDISHTQETLGWSPPYTVSESMQWAFGKRGHSSR